jgi:hypothetical protein
MKFTATEEIEANTLNTKNTDRTIPTKRLSNEINENEILEIDNAISPTIILGKPLELTSPKK